MAGSAAFTAPHGSIVLVFAFALASLFTAHRITRDIVVVEDGGSQLAAASSNKVLRASGAANGGIPRVLHYLWPNKNFTFDASHELEEVETHNRINEIRRNNPSWKIMVWTDDECHSLLKEHFPSFYPTWKERLRPKLKMWDAVRPAILSVHGGIYLDHDISCDKVNFTEWIAPGTKLLLRTMMGRRLGNHFMGASRGHALWTQYIQNIVDDIDKNETVLDHTGPGQLGYTYEYWLLDNPDESDSVRVLERNELSNGNECENYAKRKGLGKTYCEVPRCIHQHGISPAEINGEDDNAEAQLHVSAIRNKMWTDGGRSPGGLAKAEGKKNPDYSSPPQENVVATQKAEFDVPPCKPCDRLEKLVRTSEKLLGKNETPVVFVHTPKTAGTTVEDMLGIRGSCHVTASALLSCDPRLYESALSFTVLRHPVDRAVSMYDYAKRGGNGLGMDKFRTKWVRDEWIDFDAFVEKLPTKWEYHYAPMAHFLVDGNLHGVGSVDNVTDDVKGFGASKLLVKEILCSDDLEAGWKRLVSLKPSLGAAVGEGWTTEHLRSSGNHTVDVVSPRTLKKLQRYYKDDFELWSQHCGGRGSLLFPKLESRES